MVNAFPVFGWAISLVLNISLAVPFWFCWTVCGLGAYYFDFLPSKFHVIPFWECVGLFIICSILKAVMLPRFSIENKTEVRQDKPPRGSGHNLVWND